MAVIVWSGKNCDGNHADELDASGLLLRSRCLRRSTRRHCRPYSLSPPADCNFSPLQPAVCSAWHTTRRAARTGINKGRIDKPVTTTVRLLLSISCPGTGGWAVFVWSSYHKQGPPLGTLKTSSAGCWLRLPNVKTTPGHQPALVESYVTCDFYVSSRGAGRLKAVHMLIRPWGNKDKSKKKTIKQTKTKQNNQHPHNSNKVTQEFPFPVVKHDFFSLQFSQFSIWRWHDPFAEGCSCGKRTI